jgi:peptidoglycan/LPS O-acetylase OafA/YrhL
MLLGIVLHAMLSFVGWPVWPVQDINQSEFYGIPILFIHGFRMPLFFFVSGFFTMLLWKRKGTKELMSNRCKRIVLPFIFFSILLIPLLNHMRSITAWITPENISNDSEEIVSFPSASIQAKDLSSAAKAGNIQVMKEFLRDGANINGKNLKELTPLHWAATTGQEKAISLLIQEGATVDSLDGYQSTPLHLAAFFGQEEAVQVLLANGADPNVRNKDQSSPRDTTYAGKALTEMVANEILEVPLQWDQLQKRRISCRNLIENSIHNEKLNGGAKQNLFTQYYLTFGDFITHHLWFLYDLIYLIAAFLILSHLLGGSPLKKIAEWVVSSPLRMIFLVPITYWSQFFMKEDFGPSTDVWLAPNWTKLGYYGIFFGYGALCFGNKVFTKKFGKFWPLSFIGSLAVFIGALTCMHYKNWEWSYEILTLCSACFVWLMIFGCIGLFRKFFSVKMPKVRYISDSAYWLYIIHLPVVQIMQALFANWEIPSLFKCMLITILTTMFILLSYQYLIRYTWVGAMLNGKRYKANETV